MEVKERDPVTVLGIEKGTDSHRRRICYRSNVSR